MNEPPSPDATRFLDAALAACRRAGEIHLEHFRSSHLQVDLKKDASPVTVADRGSEEAIREILRRATPELGLLGEEFGQEGSERDRWIIDPIDATKNFVAGLPYFATLIGLELDGEIVLGVVHAAALGETWWAARGEGAWAGTGTAIETCRRRRLQVTQISEIEQAFIVHGGLKQFQLHGFWPALSEVVARASRTRGFGDWWGHVLVAEGRCDADARRPRLPPRRGGLEAHPRRSRGRPPHPRGEPLVTGWQDAAFSCNRNLAEALRSAMGGDPVGTLPGRPPASASSGRRTSPFFPATFGLLLNGAPGPDHRPPPWHHTPGFCIISLAPERCARGSHHREQVRPGSAAATRPQADRCRVLRDAGRLPASQGRGAK